jgi:hypothetical protein
MEFKSGSRRYKDYYILLAWLTVCYSETSVKFYRPHAVTSQKIVGTFLLLCKSSKEDEDDDARGALLSVFWCIHPKPPPPV